MVWVLNVYVYKIITVSEFFRLSTIIHGFNVSQFNYNLQLISGRLCVTAALYFLLLQNE